MAEEADKRGVIVAFRNEERRDRAGFSLLASCKDGAVAIYGSAVCVGRGFGLVAMAKRAPDAQFFLSHIHQTAAAIGMSNDDLFAALAKRQEVPPFTGFVCRILHRGQDNNPLWQEMWRQLESLSLQKPFLRTLPAWANDIAYKKLRAAAEIGQIVLV